MQQNIQDECRHFKDLKKKFLPLSYFTNIVHDCMQFFIYLFGGSLLFIIVALDFGSLRMLFIIIAFDFSSLWKLFIIRDFDFILSGCIYYKSL